MKKKSCIVNLLKCVFIAITFFVVDFTLRFFTRWLGYYSIFEFAPSLFTVCWGAVFVVLLSLLPKKIGQITYAVLYTVAAVYAVVQYVYYLIFDKFIFLSDVRYAGEGGAYLRYVMEVINGNVFGMIILFLGCGIAGVLLFPDFKKISTKLFRSILRITIAIITCVGFAVIPNLYTENTDAPFLSSAYEYEAFSNSGFDMEIMGMYQYIAKDFQTTFKGNSAEKEELIIRVNAFLEEKKEHTGNDMTGVLEGKNLILVQLESLDDWVINEDSAPTITYLMNEGINFSNMYTCLYGSGSTFSTEFAFNTGIYQSTKGGAAYSCSRNTYSYSLANLFGSKGYSANSFHGNVGSYYNRTQMHAAFGYEHYYSLLDYVTDSLAAQADSIMVENDTVWELMTAEQPFFSFLITYSAHVPYTADNELSQLAISMYPEYLEMDISDEMKYLYAKVRLTDSLFAALLERLDEEGLLENTAIIAYTDHYCYGLSDKELVHALTEANGTSILERTPAFIWYEGCESMAVDKVCQTVDWVPTIANLFGMDVSEYVMGNDIFDDRYEGYAIFPDGTWLTNEAYAVNGIIQWNNGMTEKEISEMNSFVQTFYAANEAILASDYYAQFEE